jgi:hypothetical protein
MKNPESILTQAIQLPVWIITELLPIFYLLHTHYSNFNHNTQFDDAIEHFYETSDCGHSELFLVEAESEIYDGA